MKVSDCQRKIEYLRELHSNSNESGKRVLEQLIHRIKRGQDHGIKNQH